MTAETMGDVVPVIYRFTLGEAEVTTILDGAHRRDTINPPFAMDMTDAEIARIAAENNLPSDGFENSYTVTLVSIAGVLVLFDTGFGESGRAGGAGYLRERMAQAGYRPEDVDIVAFTHCHPDHIQGVMEGDDPAFPNARYVIGRREYDAWLSGEGIPPERAATREMFLRLIPPLADRMTMLDDADEVVPGIRAEAAYGHAPGHMMFRVTSGNREVLIWGDVANHYVFSVQYPDSTVGFDNDSDMAKATRHRVLEMVAREGTLIVGFHMPFPAVGYVQKLEGRYRWVPVSYQLRL